MKILYKVIVFTILFTALHLVLINGDKQGHAIADDDTSVEAVSEQEIVLPYQQQGYFEIGGTLGMPSGINMRYWFFNIFGFDMNLGTTLRRDFSATFDLLFEFVELYGSNTMRLRFFFGPGALVGYQYSDFYSNVRFPVGLSMPFMKTPLTLSLYVAPACIVAPDIRFDMNWGFAARFNLGVAKKLKNRETLLNYKLESLQQGYGRVKDKLDTTQRELDQAIGELQRTGGELNTTRGKLGKTMDKLMDTRKELEGTRSELTDTRQKLDSTMSDLSDTKGKLDLATDQLATMKRELDTTKTRLDVTRQELSISKKQLDDRERELKDKQAELNSAKSIIDSGLTKSEKEEEERKIAEKQKQLDGEIERFEKQKEQWTKKNEKQIKRREQLKSDCQVRRGIINEDGYCDCREHEQWNSDRSECVCVKGYKLNIHADRCEPCETVTYSGACTEACGSDEKRVPLKSGPHKYVCVKKCRKKNEMWSERKQDCVCKDGYYRDTNGECVPRR